MATTMITKAVFVLVLALEGSAQLTGLGADDDHFYYPKYPGGLSQHQVPEIIQVALPQAQTLAQAYQPQPYQEQEYHPRVLHPQTHQPPAYHYQDIGYDYDPYAYSGDLGAYQTSPLSYNGIQVATPAPFVPIDNQYQVADDYGQYAFGFRGGDSARTETRDVYGNVRGSYNYIDSDGKLQTQHYVADNNGFRVVASNIPEGPQAPTVQDAPAAALPSPVKDTPEVAAAKAAFAKAYNEAALAAAEAPDTK